MEGFSGLINCQEMARQTEVITAKRVRKLIT